MRGNYIEIPSETFRSWGIRSRELEIRAGGRSARTEIVEAPHRRQPYLSPLLQKDLAISDAGDLLLRYDELRHQLRLGPVVGILSTSIPNQSSFDHKSVQAELIYMSLLSRTLPGQYFVFTPKTIDWEKQLVRGYRFVGGSNIFEASGQEVLNKRGSWTSQVYPLPDVVYDRVASRKAEGSAAVQECKAKLLALPDLKYFNQSYLNKWDVYKYLNGDEALRPYLPDTLPCNEKNMLAMLGRYPVLFIKPSDGTLGHGIIKTETLGNTLHFTMFLSTRERGRALSIQDFMHKTQKVRGKRPYIVQQGLYLARYNDSPFDLRIIYQKDENGQWTISKQFCRIAPPGSSIANLSRGGKAETTKKVFARLYRKNKAVIQEKNLEIAWLCGRIAERLESSTGQIFGELGLDLGIDEQGRLWLIEINSRPRKTTTTNFSMKIVRNTFSRPLEYAKFLAGFH